jgi:hypothetical protein
LVWFYWTPYVGKMPLLTCCIDLAPICAQARSGIFGGNDHHSDSRQVHEQRAWDELESLYVALSVTFSHHETWTSHVKSRYLQMGKWSLARVMTSETNDAIHSFFTVYTADGISFYIYIFLGFWQKLLWIGKTAEAASSEATAAKASARSVPTCLICWWGACCSMLDSKNAWEASFLIQIGSVRCPGRSSSRVEIQGSEIFQHTQHWNRDRNDVRKCRHRKCLLEPGRQS